MFGKVLRSLFTQEKPKTIRHNRLRSRLTLLDLESRLVPTAVYSIDATKSLTEGESRFVTVRRSGDDLSQRTVSLAIYNGTAIGGKDFTTDLVAGKLTFDEGAETASIQITATDEQMYEKPQETFRIVLTSAPGGRIQYGGNTCTVTINDNDPKPTFWYDVSNAGETREGNGNLTVTLRLSNPSYEATHVKIALIPNAQYAKVGYDASLTGVYSSYYFTAGKMSADGSGPTKTFTLTIKDDSVVEDTESFFLRMTADKGLQPRVQSDEIVIRDNDIPKIKLLPIGGRVEGHVDHDVEFRFQLVGQTAERTITAFWFTQNGSAVSGQDYDAVSNGQAVFQISAYYPYAKAKVRIRGDKGWAPNENFFIKLAPRVDYVSVTDTAEIVILNDDPR